jgi:hypothetical protein
MKGDVSFVQSGNVFRLNQNSSNTVHPLLPVGNYIIGVTPQGEMFLSTADPFELPKKLYGDVTKHTDRILNTFGDRPAGTGVMLSGEKGSGKSLLAKNLVVEGGLRGYPTILINSPFIGEAFNLFIQNINQPVILLFDEFEKVYDNEQQEQLLTLLDGSFPSQKLFILTCNDKWRVDAHMRNRPGRIYYSLEFTGLKAEFVRQYASENLHNKSHLDTLVNFSGVFANFNFDMLQAIVEEMNRYNESPQEVVELLNTKVEYAGKENYTVELFYNGVKIPDYEPTEWQGNVITGTVHIWVEKADIMKALTGDEKTANTSSATPKDLTSPVVKQALALAGVNPGPPGGKPGKPGQIIWPEPESESDDDGMRLVFSPNELVAINPEKGTTTYKKDEFLVILKKKVVESFNIWNNPAF